MSFRYNKDKTNNHTQETNKRFIFDMEIQQLIWYGCENYKLNEMYLKYSKLVKVLLNN